MSITAFNDILDLVTSVLGVDRWSLIREPFRQNTATGELSSDNYKLGLITPPIFKNATTDYAEILFPVVYTERFGPLNYHELPINSMLEKWATVVYILRNNPPIGLSYTSDQPKEIVSVEQEVIGGNRNPGYYLVDIIWHIAARVPLDVYFEGGLPTGELPKVNSVVSALWLSDEPSSHPPNDGALLDTEFSIGT